MDSGRWSRCSIGSFSTPRSRIIAASVSANQDPLVLSLTLKISSRARRMIAKKSFRSSGSPPLSVSVEDPRLCHLLHETVNLVKGQLALVVVVEVAMDQRSLQR